MAFNVFDRDKNGGISQNELKYILGEYNPTAKEQLWKKMIEQIDLNKDGQISYEEFHKMMMEVINNKNKRMSMQLRISRPQIHQQYKTISTQGNSKGNNKDNNIIKLNTNKKRNKSFLILNKKNSLEE